MKTLHTTPTLYTVQDTATGRAISVDRFTRREHAENRARSLGVLTGEPARWIVVEYTA